MFLRSHQYYPKSELYKHTTVIKNYNQNPKVHMTPSVDLAGSCKFQILQNKNNPAFKSILVLLYFL
jgi:hypothetical protein